MLKTVCVDFDGVLNRYEGWKGHDDFPPPREGATEFLRQLCRDYQVVVFSTRKEAGIRAWLSHHNLAKYVAEVTNVKRAAHCYIDDRALRFNGDFTKTLADARNFKAYWEK